VRARSTPVLIAAAALAWLAFESAPRAETIAGVAPLAPPAAAASPEAAASRLPLAPAASAAVPASAIAPAAASEPAKGKRVPLAKRWWFWASLGAAAVGVVVAALFLGPRDPYVGNASPGSVTVF
jgi:hypothetical protein